MIENEALARIRIVVTATAVAIGVGCSKGDVNEDAPRDRVANGETIYRSMCASCHGVQGEGARGPSLRDIGARRTEPDLVRFVDEQMPLGDPDRCNGTCAGDVVAYVLAAFRGPVVCEAPAPAARGLRLLTNREYANTVTSLFGVGTAAPSCEPHVFTFDPAGRSVVKVHVAGSFNGWAKTVADGGWALTATSGKWAASHAVPNGHHTYKLVVNESEWLADPTNPVTESDGFGGKNSVLDVACPVGSSEKSPSATFPPDTRPEGFPFDDHGPGRMVTAVLADEHVRAAKRIAAELDLFKTAGCDVAAAGACTESLVRSVARRAFRRPPSDAEVARYVAVSKVPKDAAAGARAAIAAILASPSFLYRSEIGELRGGVFRLTSWEVASAISYFLWGTTPDDALLVAAEHGELDTKDGRERHARRLLADPRARTQIETFAEQWLGAESVSSVNKSEVLYPNFDEPLRRAMLAETRRFVAHVFFDGSRRVEELFTAEYTFANDRLARHYGLALVAGEALRQVPYPDGLRSGILGHGSVLATTGHSDQSSPIRRGLFVRRRLLCQEFPPPPPNAGGVPKVDPSATTRERFAQHTQNAACRSCHQYIDPVGFGFERFDTTGRLRDTEAGKPIDAAGDMNDVEALGAKTHAPFENLRQLGRALASSEAARRCVVRQTYRFCRGRIETDACEIDPLFKAFEASGGDLLELLVALVSSEDFVTRK